MLYLERHDLHLRTFPEGNFSHTIISPTDAKKLIEQALEDEDFFGTFKHDNRNPKQADNPNTSEPVQTRADQFEPVHTGANPSEPNVNMANDSQILELEAQVRSLEIDKGVRDQHIKFLTEQNKAEHDLALRQNKYIGHLETKIYALGDKPDIKFLDAPNSSEPEMTANETGNDFTQSHPDQQNLYTGRA